MENNTIENNAMGTDLPKKEEIMDGGFETDFFSPLPPEEPVAKKKKKSGKNGKKIIIGVVVALVIAACATVAVFACRALGRDAKDRFWDAFEALGKETGNYPDIWTSDVDMESISDRMNNGATSTDVSLNLTLPDMDTIGFDILHNSNYPEKLSNTDIEVSMYTVPLIEGSIIMDDDVCYVSLPELLKDVYSVDFSTFGEDYNASVWAAQTGAYLDDSEGIDFFSTNQEYLELVEEYDQQFLTAWDKMIENSEVKETGKTKEIKRDGKAVTCEGLRVVLKEEDLNGIVDVLAEFMEASGQTQEFVLSEFDSDWELEVYLDNKDRIVSIATAEPIVMEDSSIGGVEFSVTFSGKDNVLDIIEGSMEIEIADTDAAVILSLEREAVVKDDTYEDEMTFWVEVDDGFNEMVMEISYQNEWNLEEKEFDTEIVAAVDGYSYSMEAQGAVLDIVKGESFTVDLSKFKVYENDTELLKITGTISVAPFEGTIEVPRESVDFMGLTEDELNAIGTEFIDSLYKNLLGE